MSGPGEELQGLRVFFDSSDAIAGIVRWESAIDRAAERTGASAQQIVRALGAFEPAAARTEQSAQRAAKGLGSIEPAADRIGAAGGKIQTTAQQIERSFDGINTAATKSARESASVFESAAAAGSVVKPQLHAMGDEMGRVQTEALKIDRALSVAARGGFRTVASASADVREEMDALTTLQRAGQPIVGGYEAAMGRLATRFGDVQRVTAQSGIRGVMDQLRGLPGIAGEGASALGLLGAGLGTVGIAGGLLAGTILAMTKLKGAITEATESEDSLVRLGVTLKGLGSDTQQGNAGLEERFQILQRLTRLSDEQARDAFSQLALITGDARRAYELYNGALNISAARGIDLNGVVRILALGIETGQLQTKGLGLALDEESKKAFAAGSELDRINIILAQFVRVGPAAIEMANTASGVWTRLGHAISENFSEKFGALVTEPFKFYTDQMGVLQAKVEDFDKLKKNPFPIDPASEARLQNLKDRLDDLKAAALDTSNFEEFGRKLEDVMKRARAAGGQGLPFTGTEPTGAPLTPREEKVFTQEAPPPQNQEEFNRNLASRERITRGIAAAEAMVAAAQQKQTNAETYESLKSNVKALGLGIEQTAEAEEKYAKGLKLLEAANQALDPVTGKRLLDDQALLESKGRLLRTFEDEKKKIRESSADYLAAKAAGVTPYDFSVRELTSRISFLTSAMAAGGPAALFYAEQLRKAKQDLAALQDPARAAALAGGFKIGDIEGGNIEALRIKLLSLKPGTEVVGGLERALADVARRARDLTPEFLALKDLGITPAITSAEDLKRKLDALALLHVLPPEDFVGPLQDANVATDQLDDATRKLTRDYFSLNTEAGRFAASLGLSSFMDEAEGVDRDMSRLNALVKSGTGLVNDQIEAWNKLAERANKAGLAPFNPPPGLVSAGAVPQPAAPGKTAELATQDDAIRISAETARRAGETRLMIERAQLDQRMVLETLAAQGLSSRLAEIETEAAAERLQLKLKELALQEQYEVRSAMSREDLIKEIHERYAAQRLAALAAEAKAAGDAFQNAIDKIKGETAPDLTEGQRSVLALADAYKDLRTAEALGVAAHQKGNDAKLASDQAYATSSGGIEQDLADSKVQLAFMAARTGIAVAEELFGKNKSLAIAAAIINTAQAATKALADFPYPANIVVMAATIALGVAQIQKIRSASPGGGDAGSSSGGSTTPARPNESATVSYTPARAQHGDIVPDWDVSRQAHAVMAQAGHTVPDVGVFGDRHPYLLERGEAVLPRSLTRDLLAGRATLTGPSMQDPSRAAFPEHASASPVLGGRLLAFPTARRAQHGAIVGADSFALSPVTERTVRGAAGGASFELETSTRDLARSVRQIQYQVSEYSRPIASYRTLTPAAPPSPAPMPTPREFNGSLSVTVNFNGDRDAENFRKDPVKRRELARAVAEEIRRAG